jgi:predicted dienelactone hydrolase
LCRIAAKVIMRSLEWLFLLSFIPALLLPFVPQTRRRYGILAAVLLPLLAGALHLVGEGWRIQIAPLYVLALGMLVTRLPEFVGRAAPLRQRRGVLASGIITLFMMGTAIGAGWLLPVATLPSPTGPYAAGVVERELVDEVRGRRLMATVWYPAAQTGTPAPFTAHPDIIAEGLASSFGFPALALQHVRYMTVTASTNAPLAAGSEAFPVLIFSHGLVGLRMQNSVLLQDLASWGYVVLALDHTDAAAVTVFPDGEARYFDLSRFGITYEDDGQHAAAVNERLFPVWVADQRFVFDTLEAWAADDSLLAGRIDEERFGVFGHSFGGATALEVCRVDVRCRVAVNLDGGLWGDMVTQPSTRPLLLMTAAGSRENETAMNEWRRMVDAATAAAYWLELPASNHLSFTDMPLLSPLLVPDGFDPRHGMGTINNYVRAFFDVHLRDGDAQQFAPSPDRTDVHWIAYPP